MRACLRYVITANWVPRADDSGHPPGGAGDGGALCHPMHRGVCALPYVAPLWHLPISAHSVYPIPSLAHQRTNLCHYTHCVLPTAHYYVRIPLTTHQVSTSIKTNLLVLKAQLYALRQYSIDPRSTPVYHKYFMFRRFPCPLLDLCVCCLPAPSYRLLFSVVVCNSSICMCMCMHTGASLIQRPSMCI